MCYIFVTCEERSEMGKKLEDLEVRVNKFQETITKDLQEIKNALKIVTTKSSENKINPETSSNSDVYSEILKKVKQIETDAGSEFDSIRKLLHSMKYSVNRIQTGMARYDSIYYSKRLVVHGINGNVGNLCNYVLQTIIEKCGVNISINNINYSYRLGKKSGDNNEDTKRPVLVEFCQRWVRNEVFASKKRLKGSKITITEMLPLDTIILFKKVRKLVGRNCWTRGGVVYVLDADGNKRTVKSDSDLNDLNPRPQLLSTKQKQNAMEGPSGVDLVAGNHLSDYENEDVLGGGRGNESTDDSDLKF